MKLVRLAAAAAALVAVAATPAAAQRGRTPEFTRQGLLVTNLEPADGVDTTLGYRVADLLRERLEKHLDKREVEVVQSGTLRGKLERAGFDGRGLLDMTTIEQLGRTFRVDELVLGTVARTPRGVRVQAQLVLMRDRRMRQPLPAVEGASPEAAADALTRAVAAARAQLPYQRRCENALREGRHADAIRIAREGAALSPQHALARICLTTALRLTSARAPDVLAVARELLAVDSMSAHGLEAAGLALDSLRQRPEAARLWLRLAETDPANLELTERVLWALHENGNSRAAEPLVERATAAHPDTLRLLQLQWRIAHANESWPLAVRTGELLLARDPVAPTDSGFVVRLVSAYQRNAQPYHAIAAAARGVSAIPSARLYALYAELIRAESDTVLPRGLALYPKSADLLALSARALRAEGRLAEALDATRAAVALDPAIPGGLLSIAQAEFDLGRPDSALASLRRMVAAPAPPATPPVAAPVEAPVAAAAEGDAEGDGADTRGPAPVADDSVAALVAQFALAKGNLLLRTADAAKTVEAFDLALRYLALADTLRPTVPGRFLIGVAALGVASSAVSASIGQPPADGCALIRVAGAQAPVAREALEIGRQVAAEAAAQYLAFLERLEPYVAAQMAGGCGG